jgi:hypothetical protein
MKTLIEAVMSRFYVLVLGLGIAVVGLISPTAAYAGIKEMSKNFNEQA